MNAGTKIEKLEKSQETLTIVHLLGQQAEVKLNSRLGFGSWMDETGLLWPAKPLTHIPQTNLTFVASIEVL